MKYSALLFTTTQAVQHHLYVPEANIFIAQDSEARNFFEPLDDSSLLQLNEDAQERLA